MVKNPFKTPKTPKASKGTPKAAPAAPAVSVAEAPAPETAPPVDAGDVVTYVVSGASVMRGRVVTVRNGGIVDIQFEDPPFVGFTITCVPHGAPFEPGTYNR